MKRRALLRRAVACAAVAAAPGTGRVQPRTAQRVLIVGAGWAGLSAAHALRRQASELDVLVLDREPVWRALPLSSAWLVGATPERLPRIALAELARAQGWRFASAEVTAIDRDKRTVHTRGDRHGYDWLVLATGATSDPTAWFGADAAAAQQARTRWSAGFEAHELDAAKRGLDAFAATGGGTLVMTVPPGPTRCPPAPYERAALLGWWIKTRKLAAKLVLIDAGGGMPRFNRLLADRYKPQVEHLLHSAVQAVDVRARTITTEMGALRFDHALLLPPMHAGALVAQAGLLGSDAQGQPARWAAVDPLTLRAAHDERIYLIGDAIGPVSPLFGAYPKTAQIAAELGAAAAAQIAAASRGLPAPPPSLPHSQCHVWLDAEPREQLQIEVSHRLRGDGVIAQSVRQIDNPQPRDEDLAWARGLLAQRLGIA